MLPSYPELQKSSILTQLNAIITRLSSIESQPKKVVVVVVGVVVLDPETEL